MENKKHHSVCVIILSFQLSSTASSLAFLFDLKSIKVSSIDLTSLLLELGTAAQKK